ncbi:MULTISPECIES: DNA recombination protein RmuC [unclassified Haematospirillum]|uniref:DNA recombination protein RmuC n=1 Tax=unclassified Haematospirillum TaxID=2622088 RepID=UPI001439C581|nr:MULTISPECIES: DNA recombination protein RmuC [unclassified Haematospirillum]NKD54002.1 DNA recombination protein RmuC [Haematospirillum sp. H4890]NKD74047.1 DNA recombination protein RmuC [Haematospirillum sp. H4485]NKD87281.1 DNA recombination protein RmuC [Haematospirillum sp. 15-248]
MPSLLLDVFLVTLSLGCAALAGILWRNGARIRETLSVTENERERLSVAWHESECTRAVLQERISHLVDLEDELRQQHALRRHLEQELGSLRETAGRLETVNQEQKDRLGVAERISAQMTTKLEHLERERADLQSRLAVVTETLEQERRQANERLALLKDARDQMGKEFRVLAEGVITQHSTTFTRQNREQIEAILAPMRQKLSEFQQGLQSAHVESSKDRAALAEQIRTLTETGARMSNETHNLTQALKGKSKTQGAWGEMVLTSILERSGLREGEEYQSQETFTTEDGKRLRPDVVVYLPGGQKVIVDSKVSLTAFEACINAETDAERTAQAKAHVTSLRNHIRDLSGKTYQNLPGIQLDYVILFVPIEGALALALQEDPELTACAAEANIAIATPTTLMIALRTIAAVWKVERRNSNAEEIAALAGKMYDKLTGFVEDMQMIGTRLNQTHKSYDAAMNKLSSGHGNLLRQAQRVYELGGKASKKLPPELVSEDTPAPSQPALPPARAETTPQRQHTLTTGM